MNYHRIHHRLPPPIRDYASTVKFELDGKSDLLSAVCPKSLLDEYLTDLCDRFDGVPLFFKFPAGTFYNFHVDRLRKCALNYEISGRDGVLFFGNPLQKAVENVVEVRYFHCFLLLNTTVPHAVYSPGERIVFSLGFNHHSFETVSNHT